MGYSNRLFTWLLLFAGYAICSIVVIFELHASNDSRITASSLLLPVAADREERPSESSGTTITRQSYEISYKELVEFCPRQPLGTVPTALEWRECAQKYWEHCKGTGCRSGHTPWWFQTLMRDTADRRTGVFGGWHDITLKPDLQACVMEKVGTKHWRGMRTKDRLQKDYHRSVFLRDPLERFLSGFLDKCHKRQREDHCEPFSVFQDPNTTLVADFVADTKKLFDIYVETFPLKWNVHFVPQSFLCKGGLYRFFDHMDFVGKMDATFYDQLGVFGRKYGLEEETEKEFEISRHVNKTRTKGVETSAVSHVEAYYSPRTVRRVLEMMSIDYIALNLTIPEWAENMLLEEQ